MKNYLKGFKKITCILGITFLVMGMVPLPAVIQVVPTPEVAAVQPVAEKIEINPYLFKSEGESKGLTPVDFSGVNLMANPVQNRVACQGQGELCGPDQGSCCEGLRCMGSKTKRCLPPPPEPVCTTRLCPQHCGYEGGDIGQTGRFIDGKCETFICPAKCACEESCPANCGYEGGDVVPDGRCGYKTCAAVPAPAAQECPTTCGYPGGLVPDGKCGLTVCDPVPAPLEEKCPTSCGYPGGTVPDGRCGEKQCAKTAKCEKTCPDYCGYPGGTVPDGTGGQKACAAVVCLPPIPVTGAGGPTDPLVIIPVTGVDLTLNLTGLQRLFMTMGFMLFGVTMVLEGVDKRLKAK